jgi:hypothetical protein
LTVAAGTEAAPRNAGTVRIMSSSWIKCTDGRPEALRGNWAPRVQEQNGELWFWFRHCPGPRPGETRRTNYGTTCVLR